MVLVGYDQEQHHSFRDFDDCEELRYVTLLVPLRWDVQENQAKSGYLVSEGYANISKTVCI